MRAFVDEGVANERSGPGDAAVRRVEQADLGFLVRRNGIDQLRANAFPVRASGAKFIFDHPLNETFAHHRRRVGPAGRGADALGHVRRRARCNAVDHIVRASRVIFYPIEQVFVAQLLDKLHQPAARAVTVMTQVVAAQQCHRASLGVHARFEQHGQRAVNRRAGRTLACARQIGDDVGRCAIKPVFGA